MSYDYSRMRRLAIRLINKFGSSVTLKRKIISGGGFNPTSIFADPEIKAVEIDSTTAEGFGVLVDSGYKAFLTYDEAKTDDIIIKDECEHSVVQVTIVEPGATKLIYIVKARI